jgi:hypothetical protein
LEPFPPFYVDASIVAFLRRTPLTKTGGIMTKLFAVMVSMALIVTVAVSPVWAVGDKVRSDKAACPAGETGDGDGQASRGTPVEKSAQLLSVQEDMTGK